MSAPRLPQAVQVKRGSMSDSPSSSGQRIGAEGDGMAAVIVGAIDQDTAHARLAHVAEGDLHRAVTGRAIALAATGLRIPRSKRHRKYLTNCRFLAARTG